MKVYADLRWPAGTGIGAVQSELLARVPSALEVVDLGVSGRIGSPLSPLRVSQALARRGGVRGVFWSPGYIPPLTSTVPAVVTVHDLTHLHYYTRFHAAYYRVVLRNLYHRCRAIVCVSDYTRQEFLSWSGIPPERVFTVYNGVSLESFSAAAATALPYPYILYPGNRRSYKNLDRLLQAYGRSALPTEGIHLMLTGDPDEHLHAKAREAGIDALVHYSGFVTADGLARLYRGATLVAFVSLYEGFGLPLIEGMAAGVPVLSSNVSAMPEIAGQAALLVDPTSTIDIMRGLEALAFDQGLRSRLIEQGRLRCAEFSWERSAAAVWKIVADAAGG